jgi:UDP-N-acetylglucosamine--N-acetylmuramyl-(pentapeptide) pyrophosphoryl-undecaprenol N-acetylglucosamine transferase
MSQRDGTLVLVAANGGHLAQLHDIANRLPHRGPRLWVTFDDQQGRTLLAGEKVIFIPYIAERDVLGVARALPHARRILTREGGVSAVVSTGSAIALDFLPYAAMCGIPAHYVESAARTGRASLTGRLLSAIPGVHLYRQYAHTARGRWKYGGSVFDGFEPARKPTRPVRRVVVTLGISARFRRLLERLVTVIPNGTEVLWQTGRTPTDGLAINAQRFVSATALLDAMREADAVVAHAGCGSALAALKAGKCPVLVPRDPSSGDEVVDAHQSEIAAWLEEVGLAFSRPVEMLSFADLQHASERVITRTSALPAFRLAGTA